MCGRMRKLLVRLSDVGLLWTVRHSEVARFDGIGLADVRRRGDSFARTIGHSLRLVKELDARRYARITRLIRWIVNGVYVKGTVATYFLSIRTCWVQFEDDFPELTEDILAGIYACMLVHESTHGVIASRGIKYSPANRTRIERLCVTEETRFAERLVASDPARYPSSVFVLDFAAEHWDDYWTQGPLEKSLSILSRTLTDRARTRRPTKPPPSSSEGDLGRAGERRR